MSHINLRIGRNSLQVIWWPRALWPPVTIWRFGSVRKFRPPLFFALTLPLVEFRWYPSPRLLDRTEV